MSLIPLPTTRPAQIARKKIISAVKDYQMGKENFEGLLHNFFCAAKDDLALESSLAKEAYTILSHLEDTSSFEKCRSDFIQQLLTLPLINEENDPYYLCANDEERIDRQIVNNLHKNFPVLLQDESYLSYLDFSTCAHLCYARFATMVNRAIEEIPSTSSAYSSSSFLREVFYFIETIIKLQSPYAANVIAVSFLEDLTERNKEKWIKLLYPLSRQVYQQLIEHLERLFPSRRS